MKMTNATSNSKGHANLIPYYNAQLERLHLKMGQQFSHKSVLQSRPSRLLFVSCISQKTFFVSSWNSGQMPPPPYRCGMRTRSCPPRYHSHHPPTSFSGKPEGRGRWGDSFSQANTGSPHGTMPEGPWAPHPSWSHLLTTWALHAGDTTFLQPPEEVSKRRLIIRKRDFKLF